MSRRRIDRPLTVEEKELAEEAIRLSLKVPAHYQRFYGPRYAVDWHQEVALEICRRIAGYDPAQAPLGKWAIYAAHHACIDVLRLKADNPKSRVLNRRLRIGSLDEVVRCDQDWRRVTFADLVAVAPELPSPDDEAHAALLLRGLSPIEREAVWSSVVEGEQLWKIAVRHGLSESRLSQIRQQALARLRERLASAGGAA